MSERFNADGLILSAQYAETMEDAVLPFLAARQRDVTVRGAGDREIFCSVFAADAPQYGTALVLHGFTENAYKFAEVIYSLLQNGFSAVAYDQRGHGRSWRDEAVRADLSLTHVGRFEEYVEDLEAVYAQVLSGMPSPLVLFAHSMGGAVAGLFLEKHPDAFSRAALCAPMIAPNRGGVPLGVSRLICRGAKLLGKGGKRIFLSRPYAGPEDFDTSCATSRERFDWFDRVKNQREEFHNNGPTYNWTLESLNVTKKLLAKGAAEKIACPVRLYTADADGSVLPDAQAAFIARVKQGKREFVQGSRHEIYRSADEVLFPWWHGVLQFLQGGE